MDNRQQKRADHEISFRRHIFISPCNCSTRNIIHDYVQSVRNICIGVDFLHTCVRADYFNSNLLFRAVIEQLSITLSFVSVMNGIIHLLIIYSMSSEYRATAKNLCSFLKKRKNSVSIFRVTKIILNNRMQP